ncbi:MAG: fluoride efflux transporter CrcB [Pseudomonadota bacterium]
MQWIAVAVGGAFGAVLRFALAQFAHAVLGRDFPWGTLTVNVVGSLLIGVLYATMVERGDLTPVLRLGLITGLLGALTTFSTFSLETLALLESGRWPAALVNVATSVCICLLVCWLGLRLGRSLMPA